MHWPLARVVGLTAGGGHPEVFARQVEEWSAPYPGLFSGLGEDASVEAAVAAFRSDSVDQRG